MSLRLRTSSSTMRMLAAGSCTSVLVDSEHFARRRGELHVCRVVFNHENARHGLHAKILMSLRIGGRNQNNSASPAGNGGKKAREHPFFPHRTRPSTMCPSAQYVQISAALFGAKGRSMTPQARLEDFPLRSFDKLRYGDTDRQGHVNNAVFATLLETGRVEMAYPEGRALMDPGCAFVIARLELAFIGEILWPGRVDIGTRVKSIGRSSLRVEQALFQNERLVAWAESVIVQVNEATRKSQAFSDEAIAKLKRLVAPTPVRPEAELATKAAPTYSIRKATLDDRGTLESLIARSARALTLGEYTPRQIETALRSAFGV